MSGLVGDVGARSGVVGDPTFPAGHVIQTVQYVQNNVISLTSNFTDSFASFSTAFEKGITPKKSNSKILITMFVNVGNDDATIHFGIFKDGSELSGASAGGALSGRIGSTTSYRYNGVPYSLAVNPLALVYLDSPTIPSTPIEIKYELKATAGSSYSETFYLNRSANDTDANYSARTISTITLQEIAG